jgi:hypothetical protein
VKGAVRGVNVDFQLGTSSSPRFIFWLAASVSVLIVGLILLAFAPRAAAAVVETMRVSTGAAIGFGLVVFIGLPVVAVLALVTHRRHPAPVSGSCLRWCRSTRSASSRRCGCSAGGS